MSDFAKGLELELQSRLGTVEREMTVRAVKAGQCLRRSALRVLSGSRSGKEYRLSGGKVYRASAAGEAPAVRTGAFRQSWAVTAPVVKREVGSTSIRVGIASGLTVGGRLLGDMLEEGTSRMASRPYKTAVRDGATDAVTEIFAKRY